MVVRLSYFGRIRKDAHIPDSIGVKANNGYTVKSISLAKHMTRLESNRAVMSFVKTDQRGKEFFLLLTIPDDCDSG